MFAHYETSQGRIIDITSEDVKYPPLADKTPIKSVECGENVQVGWFYVNGEFTDHIDEPITPHDVIEHHEPMPSTSLIERISALEELESANVLNTEYLVVLQELNDGGGE